MLIRYTLFVLSIILFLYGFFPINTRNKSAKIQPPSSIGNYKFDKAIYNAELDRVVIVIIDALRYDFVSRNNTPFMWKMANSNNGCLSKVRVETPTVTLPRIKSLINGNIPQFSDVVLNLIRNEEIYDTFVHNAIKSNKTVIFYGDDTWLKLFPKAFKRSEGTSSFFVSDYTEVDNNVTRHVRIEMENKDWNVMILHYLGLDHIGHLSGPFSSLIKPKLQEMDNIIMYIYEKLQLDDKSMVLITGDHGMRDSGGHGGASYSEMHVPLVLLGYNCNTTTLSQIDIAPTIATLLGIEIPKANIGALAVNLLGNISYDKLLYKMYYNMLQLSSNYNSSLLKDATDEYYAYLTKKHNNTQKLLELYKSSIHSISTALRKNVISQDIHTLILALLSTLNVLMLHLSTPAPGRFIEWFLFSCIALQAMISLPEIVYSLILILQMLSIVLNILYAVRNWKYCKPKTTVLVVSLTIIQPFLFFSSSFIEEEHQIWYYYGITFAFFSALLNIKRRILLLDVFLLLLTFRFVRRINQTGDKWSSLPDFKLFFKDKDNFAYLIGFFAISLLYLYRSCLLLDKSLKKNRIFLATIVALTFSFRLFNDDPFIGRLVWCLIGLYYLLRRNYDNIIVTWVLVGALLLRQYNVILLPFAVYVSNIIHKHCVETDANALLHLWLGNILYFCQGHSNSLSSIDIAVGYVGLTDYYPPIVMLQVLCHSYMFPLLTYLLWKRQATAINYYLILHRMLCMFVIMLVVLLQRHHLFVWSVFAPKLLIETSHTIIIFVIMLMENINCKIPIKICLDRMKINNI